MSLMGAISTLSRRLIDVLADREGRLHVVTGGSPVIYSTTTTGALSLSTTLATDYRRPAKLKRVAVTLSTAPTTSESLTVTVYPYGSGSRPNAQILSQDPSTKADTSVIETWDYDLALGDEVTVAFTNTDVRTIKAEIVVEIL